MTSPLLQQAAEDYRMAREIPLEGLGEWREAIRAEVFPSSDMTIIDVGAGTGGFAVALRTWFGVRVIALEPAQAMRASIAQTEGIEVVAGTAEALPALDASIDAAWLGSVIHHLRDLSAAAHELRRVLRPGAPVLVRNTFPGRCSGDLRVRFFPETERSIATYPTVEQTGAAFAEAGFGRVSLRSLPQQSAPTLGEFADKIRRGADSKLRALSDEEFEAGMSRLRRAAAADPTAPATSWMDLLVVA